MGKLAREKDAQGATAWTLTLGADGRATSRMVVFEQLTSWAGPCSNEIAYRCTFKVDDPTTVALEGGLNIVSIEGRGAFAISTSRSGTEWNVSN